MADPTPLFPPKPEPHVAGEARCLGCGHKFSSVAPVGTTWLHCPACHTHRALLTFPCSRTGSLHWTCPCGNDLFHVTQEGIYCPNCGDWQRGF